MNYRFDDQTLRIFLPNRVSHNLIQNFEIKTLKCNSLIFDFSQTKYITLPGAMYIICIGNYFARRKNAKYSGCEVVEIEGNLIDILIQFGFHEMLLHLCQGNINQEIINEERRIRNLNFVNRHSIKKKSITMPLEIIQMGNENYYETYVNKFFNTFHDFYQSLSDIPSLNFLYDHSSNYQKDYSQLSNTIFEMIKNIYDHSESWGIGGIFASTKLGTQIAFFDLGVGIYQSVNKNKAFENELDSFHWAMEDGNTSRPGINQGHGFSVMKEIVSEKKGILSIRSGNYHIYNKADRYKAHLSSWFPGTQIVIFIPSKSAT